MPRKSDKRERLIDAAKTMMFRQGFNLTTLADIALAADVPLGNVYYYFKTKEAIGEAVLGFLLDELNGRLAELDLLETPLLRLNSYIDQVIADSEWSLQYGDKLGSLCQELAKQTGALSDASANLMRRSVQWLEKQFSELGHDKTDAELQANLFMARVQGMCLLATTFNDSQYLQTAGKWITADLAKVSTESYA